MSLSLSSASCWLDVVFYPVQNILSRKRKEKSKSSARAADAAAADGFISATEYRGDASQSIGYALRLGNLWALYIGATSIGGHGDEHVTYYV